MRSARGGDVLAVGAAPCSLRILETRSRQCGVGHSISARAVSSAGALDDAIAVVTAMAVQPVNPPSRRSFNPPRRRHRAQFGLSFGRGARRTESLFTHRSSAPAYSASEVISGAERGSWIEEHGKFTTRSDASQVVGHVISRQEEGRAGVEKGRGIRRAQHDLDIITVLGVAE